MNVIMKYFEVILILDNGEMIPSVCKASSASSALSVVLQKPVIRRAMEGHQLVDFDVKESSWQDELKEDLFLLQDSKDGRHWIITDQENLVVYKLPKKAYREDNRLSLLSYLEKEPSELSDDIRLSGRLLAWIARYHSDL